MGGFSEYLQKHLTESTLVLADVESLRMRAVIDESREDGVELIDFRPQVDPLFRQWNQLIQGKPIPVSEFASFCMSNRRVIVSADDKNGDDVGRELAWMFSQIRAESKVKLARGRGKGSINGIMVESVIQGEVKHEPVDLPESITIFCPVFVGRPAERIIIDILLEVRSEDVIVSATSPNITALMFSLFQDMVESIQIDGAVVSLGTVEHCVWDYVGE